MNLNDKEQRLLDWLSMEELNAFGECHGAELDRLVMLGLATILPANASAGYALVHLTEEGYKRVDRAAVEAEQNKRFTRMGPPKV